MSEKTGLKYLSAVVFVRDIQLAKQFYTETLGFEIELDFGTNVGLVGGLTIWQIDPAHIIPKRLGMSSVGDRSVNRFELYFETEDLAAARERVRKAGCEFLHEIHEEPWGQMTMRFFDPDRHLIEIGESMNGFVKRFRDEGMNAEQVSRRTSVPLAKVEEIFKALADRE
jgi:catechol 2,3-dioxygenase-like lactoylglutathione lyase family enzyme